MLLKRTKKELVTFFIIVILVTWLLWLPSVLSTLGFAVPTFLLIIAMMASFTPSIVGLLLHKKYLGKAAFRQDMNKRLKFDFSKWWLIAIPVFFLIIGGLSYYLTHLLDSGFEPTNTVPLLMTPLVFLQIFFIGGALGEEFGWRGFAYPRIVLVMSPMLGTLIIGMIWSLWHLPLFFMEGTVQSNIPIWQFMLQNTLIAYFYTWLYTKVKGNLWLMIYLHAVANTSSAIFPYWQSNVGRLLGFAVLSIACIALYGMDYITKKP